MTGAAMSLTAAASGFVVFLLSVSVVQAQDGWGVTYTATDICAMKGSTVNIRCTYTYPSNVRAQETVWFTKQSNGIYVDLRTDPEYSGRVQYQCEDKTCTLTIRDLRETDSAQYQFRFITNQPTGKYSGSPGVTLTVTAFQVQVIRSVEDTRHSADLRCESSCRLPEQVSFTWYKNGERFHNGPDYSGPFDPAGSYSCAATGHEKSSSSVTVQGHWGVTYTSTQVCAFPGSTVNIQCSYRYPSRIRGRDTRVQETFWFTKGTNTEPEDLRTQSEYSGRVQYQCQYKTCTLTIRDLRETDSAEYKFRFITNQSTGRYAGSPGVTLSVRAPQLQVHVSRSTVNQFPTWVELTCHSSCQLPDHTAYVWYQNEQKAAGEKRYFYLQTVDPAARYYCAIKGQEGFPSSPVYPPKSVSVSPSAEIVEGSSVTLTCSSDANPAAKHTWYKGNHTLIHGPEGTYQFSSISSEDRGTYYCRSENQLGQSNSSSVSIDVQYAPKLLSVSVSPSAEIVEGSSLTLTCSSDAHPAAKHTWYKGNHTLLSKEPQLIFSSIQSTDSGEYYCTAENDLGKTTSKYVLISVKYPWKLPVALTVPAVVLAFMLLPALLWIRRRRSLDQQREAEGGPDNSAQVDQLHYASVQFTRNQEDNIYSNVSPAQHQADKQEGVIYSTVLSRAGSDPRTRRPAAVEDPSSLYSSVNKRC